MADHAPVQPDPRERRDLGALKITQGALPNSTKFLQVP